MERVRFAPSPTGPLHIGGLRTALFNYLYTKNRHGVFVVRIEDTDQNRKVKGSEEYIFKALEWCGIHPDESPAHSGGYGPYRQSERLAIYKEYIDVLVKKGKAYYAFDTSEQLADARQEAEAKGEAFKYGSHNRMKFSNALTLDEKDTKEALNGKFVVRLKVDAFTTVESRDLLRGNVHVSSNEIEDKVLFKSDGYPTYHFANVVDDHLMEITTVIRGEEWLPSLPVHQLLYDAFDWDAPKFIHLPLILNPSGKGKLSKRDGDKNGYPVFPLQWENNLGYKERGFLSAAHINYIAQLGWSPKVKDEKMSLKEMVSEFSVESLQRGGARFDYDKSKWLNQQYISALTHEDLVVVADDYLKVEYKKDKHKMLKSLIAIQERIELLSDVNELVKVFFENPAVYDDKGIKRVTKKDPLPIIDALRQMIKTNDDSIKNEITKIAEQQNTGMGQVMQIMRMALVGNLSGPDISTIVKIIGKDVTLERLQLLEDKLNL